MYMFMYTTKIIQIVYFVSQMFEIAMIIREKLIFYLQKNPSNRLLVYMGSSLFRHRVWDG